MTALRYGWRLTRWAYRHRQGLVNIAAVAALWVVMTAVADRERWGLIGLLLAACLLWVYWMPVVFERRQPLLSWWRRVSVYRREWNPALTLAGLSRGGQLPRLLRVTIDGPHDVVDVQLLKGQTPEDFKAQADRLARVFGCTSCEVLAVGGGSRLIVLEFAVPGREPRWQEFPADGKW